MKTQTLRSRKATAKITIASASILTLFLVSLSPLPQLLAAAASSAGNNNSASPAAALNSVQVAIQTGNLTSVSSYNLVAYNSTGIPVASYTGQYPRVTFSLTSGTYLLAANANGPYQTTSTTLPPVCYGASQSKGVASGPGVSSPPAQAVNPGGGGSAIAYPCYYSNPPSEYGYSLIQVTGSSAVTIATKSPSSIPTTNVSVSVSYKNGTAVSDAYISTEVVGATWYWGDVSGLTMYAQTGKDGSAHLVVPQVPMVVTASKSIEVNLPKEQTTVQVNVGGQLVNVTLYYSPNYVYLSATSLRIPPQTSLNLVVTAQQPVYPILRYGVSSGKVAGAGGGGGGASAAAPGAPQSSSPNIANGPSGSAAAAGGAGAANAGLGQIDAASTQTSQQQHLAVIPPIPSSERGTPASTQQQQSSNAPSINVLTIGTIALAGAISAIVGIAISKARR